MGFEPKIWQGGDTVTAAHLNRIEQGIGDNSLPEITASDKNKYLHTNESTGALEWAEAQSGGGDVGVFVVHLSFYGSNNYVADKTITEIEAALQNGLAIIGVTDEGTSLIYNYGVFFGLDFQEDPLLYRYTPNDYFDPDTMYVSSVITLATAIV